MGPRKKKNRKDLTSHLSIHASKMKGPNNNRGIARELYGWHIRNIFENRKKILSSEFEVVLGQRNGLFIEREGSAKLNFRERKL